MLSGSVGILVLIILVIVLLVVIVIVRIGRGDLFTFRSTELWLMFLVMLLSMVTTFVSVMSIAEIGRAHV